MGITHIVQFQFESGVALDAIKDVRFYSTFTFPPRGSKPQLTKQGLYRMLSLKDNCIHPETKKPYLKSITGGKDNSIERLQVPHRLSLFFRPWIIADW